jgi:hypothetical protein
MQREETHKMHEKIQEKSKEANNQQLKEEVNKINVVAQLLRWNWKLRKNGKRKL